MPALQASIQPERKPLLYCNIVVADQENIYSSPEIVLYFVPSPSPSATPFSLCCYPSLMILSKVTHRKDYIIFFNILIHTCTLR